MGTKSSWLHEKLEVRKSSMHGSGVFAKESVSKGERLAILGGDIMLIDEINNLPEELQDLPMQIEERFVLGSRNAKEPEDTDFFNHSCSPNCGFKGQIFLVAMRDIAKDEEVAFDYAMVLSKSVGSDIIFEMKCGCGQASCRKTVTEEDWKLPELQRKYLGYFSQYLQEKIEAAMQTRSGSTREIVISTHDKYHAQIYHLIQGANAAQKEITFRQIRLRPDQQKSLSQDLIEAKDACEKVYALKIELGLKPDDLLIVVVEGNLEDEKDNEYFSVNGSDYCSPEIDCSGVGVFSLYYLNPNSAFMKDGEQWWASLGEFQKKRIVSDSILLNILSIITAELIRLPCHPEFHRCIMDFCQTPTDIVYALDGGFHFCAQMCLPALENHPRGRTVLEIANWLTKHPFRSRKLAMEDFDVFMCHNSHDKPKVREINERLKEHGLWPWLDEEQLRPGYPWQRTLEKRIERIRAAAVFVGDSGRGPWQEEEIEAFIRQFVKHQCPVIPVILPGTKGTPELPSFLEGRTWVDFRKNNPDPLGQLIWGITGDCIVL